MVRRRTWRRGAVLGDNSCVLYLCFAAAERGSCYLQIALNMNYGRVRTPEHAPRSPFNLLERIHGLAEIVERSAGVIVERHRVIRPHPEREIMAFSENALSLIHI